MFKMSAPMGENMIKITVIVFVAFFTVTNAWIPRFLHGRPKGGMLGAPVSPFSFKTSKISDLWITQRLDNFNDANTAVWNQRYMMEDSYYKQGGPVFVMIGGEGPANPAWMSNGAWIEFAKYYNAMCFMLEHRYYGKSHPTQNISTENLQYLSSEQSLADLASFIMFIKDKYQLYHNKVITFGGSYSGALSAWFRYKYPHLASGAVATSAPIFAKLNFSEYLGVVKASLDTSGPQCNQMIEAALQTVDKLIQTAEGRQQLKKTFNLCDDLDLGIPLDIANFYSVLAGNFEGVVQYNKDNRQFEGAEATNITIDVLCNVMNDKSREPIDKYAAVNSILLKAYSQKCTDFKYNSMIDDLKKTEWNSSASEGGRQWIYQTCTEFGYFQSSDLTSQPFGHQFPLNFSIQQCIDIFGEKFNQEFIQMGVNNTNRYYGGYSMTPTKVVFPNGSIDPWHALSFTSNVSPNATAIYIDGTAHCANMYPSTGSDPPQLVQARQTIQKLIGLWIS